MKNKITLVGFLGILALSACTDEKAGVRKDQLASEIVDATKAIQARLDGVLSKKETAEIIARAAEKMALNPGGFMYADELLDKALYLDPNNHRAVFYKGLLAPIMAQRGLWRRMEPWIATQPAENQAEFQKSIEAMPASPLKEFLLDGTPNIKTIGDWQAHIDATRTGLLNSRAAFQSQKQKELTAYFRTYNGASNEVILKECAPQKISDGIFEIPQCPYSENTTVTLGRPDFEILSLSYSTVAVGYTWIYTAYSYEGLDRIAAALNAESQKNGPVNYSKILAILKSEPEFLKLRNPQALKDIVSLGSEGMDAVRYALKHQPELCRTGNPEKDNRPGYLFPKGACTNSEASHTVMSLNAVLQGPFQIVKAVGSNEESNRDENRYVTEINVGQILEHPSANLLDFLPSDYDYQTHQVRFADETLGGLFPRGDASSFFNFQAQSENVTIQPAKDLH